MAKIRPEDVLAFKNSSRFDSEYYSAAYPDVLKSGMDPAEHFLWIGAKLGRSPVPPSAAGDQAGRAQASEVDVTTVRFDGPAELDALFVDGTNGTSSTPYRVCRIANGLAAEGWEVRCLKGDDLHALLDEDIRARFVIVHRAPYWSPFPEFVSKMRAAGSLIVFDVDDLIFDAQLVPLIDGYKYLTEEQKDGFLRGLQAYREFILHADMCTAPTSYLVDALRTLGKPAYRVRNAISNDNIKFFDEIGYRRKVRPKPFVVGYYSGTKTHQADFAVAAPALIRFMHANPDVTFRIVGEFDLSEYPDLEQWQYIHRPGDVPRVTRVGLMPHDAMVRDQLGCDLIIAPLETGNAFCEAKSELKFFEASLAKCPVIASPTRTFIEATQEGALASLARTTDEWFAGFQHIYNGYPAALKRAERAFAAVHTSYSQAAATLDALDAYDQFSRQSRGQPAVAEAAARGLADIGVILPDFTGPSGGHRKIFTVCKALEQAGYSLKLYFYTSRRPNSIRRDIGRMFCELDADIATFMGFVDEHRRLICTQWKSAYDCRQIRFAGDILYFVQDFEPMFYPVGSDYLRALVSYQLGFDMICYGKWIAAKLKDELGLAAKTIPFTLDHDTYVRPAEAGRRDVDILLFARPSQDRRCFELIAEGLADLKRRRPEITVGLFGEDNYGELGFDYVNYGSISRLDELAGLYHRAKVGICYSPTNPSQLGYEMVACGVVVVDVRIKFSELNFDGDAFIRYCDGTPESMSRACEALLADPEELKRRRAAGYAFVETMPADEELGRAFIEAAGFGRAGLKGRLGSRAA
jgi:glycosyltransferase involved in cell wall biosynthesis